jgi:hypothetical protein
MPELFAGLEKRYSKHLVDTVGWCLSLNPLERPQSVFALQRALKADVEAAEVAEEGRPQGLARWLDTLAGRFSARRRSDDQTLTLGS